jgi:chaperonin GroES
MAPRNTTRHPTEVQRKRVPHPIARIGPGESRRRQVREFEAPEDPGEAVAKEPLEDPHAPDANGITPTMRRLEAFINAKGDISHMLDDGELTRIGSAAIQEFRMDEGSNASWREMAERAMLKAAQEREDEGGEEKDYPFEDAADINYPMLTVASQSWVARAAPELIKGDKVVGVKTFNPPMMSPTPQEIAKAAPPPQSPQEQQQDQAEIQQDQQQLAQAGLKRRARDARAERVKHFLNWLIFYKMDGWEDDTDQLLTDLPTLGCGFKKVYMTPEGLCSEYVNALNLYVHKDTKSLYKSPRITQKYPIYPYEFEQGQRSGRFRDDIDLARIGQDEEQEREFIEQYRYEDLDGDGLKEPYIVTVDLESSQLVRIEPAFNMDDVEVQAWDAENPRPKRKIMRIKRWLPFPDYKFMRDPKGGFYCIGFGKLLESIMDTVDTSINQLLDAGNAQVAGGGFIASGVRLQGSGTGGSLYWRPGEYVTVDSNAPDLRNAVWERTLPEPSSVLLQMLEMLIGAAKDIASIKDVITGESPATAPVGTTLAVQNQALQGFTSVYRRVWRGFAAEFQMMFHCLRRWATDEIRAWYQEQTGGDFDQDFQGDGTDIIPVADPAVVTKMQKIARLQSLTQFAEGPLGQAAGMTQSAPAQEIARELLDVLEYDNPDRFFAPVQPNPELVAKVQDIAASTQVKKTQAAKNEADVNLIGAKAVREAALAADDAHGLNKEASRIASGGQIHDVVPPVLPGEQPNAPAPNAAPSQQGS